MMVFNGGFMRSVNVSDAAVSSSVRSDAFQSYVIRDDNTTFRSSLFPTFMGADRSTYIPDSMTLEVFWDQTTVALPGSTGFIEPPPDDYHPMPEIEYSEGSSALTTGDRYVRSPHFVVRPDSTSQYQGKDRYDNYMYEALRSFGGQFVWFAGAAASHFSTFNGGDLYASPTGLHLAFTYMRSNSDMTEFLTDLYHSKFSDQDGTFANPQLIEGGVSVKYQSSLLGAGNPSSFNARINPRLLHVPDVGLFLHHMKGRYNLQTDSTEFYIDSFVSRDDGTVWSPYSSIPLNLTTGTRTSAGAYLAVEQMYPPEMHWTFAENKMVCLLNFRDTGTVLGTKNHINLLISEDLGRSYIQNNLDLNKLMGSFVVSSVATDQMTVGSIGYDVKNSKFFIPVFLTGGVTVTTSLERNALFLIVNKNENLIDWEVVVVENMSQGLVTNRNLARSWLFNTNQYETANGNEAGHSTKILTYNDENNIFWSVLTGGMTYKATFNTPWAAFDDFADYSGYTPNANGQFAWMLGNFLLPLELIPSTDSILNQYRFANTPWRARKLWHRSGNITRKNDPTGSLSGIVPGNGASFGIFHDAIINNNDKVWPTTQVSTRSYPRNACYIQSITKYRNDFFYLSTEIVRRTTFQENRSIEYQIPTIIYRPTWSNINIKPRKIYYFTPTKYQDSTYAGWTGLTAAAGQTINTEYPTPTITKRYWEVKFFRNDTVQAAATLNCGLSHLCVGTPFQGNRGGMWEADATRGAFAHFGCSLDSAFMKTTNDITCLVHVLGVPQNTQSNTGSSFIWTFLGKGFVGYKSSGSAGQNFYQTFAGIDTTRDMEFLSVVNRFRGLDTTHEHRGFFRYRESSDWTFLYFTLCTVTPGASPTFPSATGLYFGNLHRWPTTITGDNTSVVYFRHHSEGWSALEMHRLYPANVSGALTPSTNNKLGVLPQPCTAARTFLPRGVQVGWSGQDATCGAVFSIRQANAKNVPSKMLDERPNIGWRSLDGTSVYSLAIDFGRSVTFNAVSLYNHNLMTGRFFYGQENATTDMTAFLLHWNAWKVDTTNFRDFCSFPDTSPANMTAVDTDTLLVYNKEFLKFARENELGGRVFQFEDTGAGRRIIKRCSSYEILSDASVYLQFERPQGNLWLSGGTQNLNAMTFNGRFLVLPQKQLYLLNRTLTARYIRIDDAVVNGGDPGFSTYRSTFDGTHQSNFDGYFKVGALSFGLFQQNENPVQHNMRTTYLTTTVLEKRYAGGDYAVPVTDKRRVRFETQFTAAVTGRGNQFEQLEHFVRYIGIEREFFYFAPRAMSYWDGTFGTAAANTSSSGFSGYTTDFYLMRLANKPVSKRNNNLASLGMTMDEVI